MASSQEKSGWWETTKHELKELARDVLKVFGVFAVGLLGVAALA